MLEASTHFISGRKCLQLLRRLPSLRSPHSALTVLARGDEEQEREQQLPFQWRRRRQRQVQFRRRENCQAVKGGRQEGERGRERDYYPNHGWKCSTQRCWGTVDIVPNDTPPKSGAFHKWQFLAKATRLMAPPFPSAAWQEVSLAIPKKDRDIRHCLCAAH